jgi:hypothetical protein
MKLLTRLLLAGCLCALYGTVEAATLTITITGPNTGNVSARPVSGNGGGLCFGAMPHPVTCTIDFPNGTAVKIMADSPSTPGIIQSGGTGDATACATSTCNFTINTDSAVTVDFNTANGPYPSIHIDMLGGKGESGFDNGRCQNWELGNSACTQFYGAGSEVIIRGRNVPGSLFVNFSGGTVAAAGCSSTPCTFVLYTNSSVSATFATLTSLAVTPAAATVTIGQTSFFSATGTFDNLGTRQLQSATGFWSNKRPMSEARFSLAAGVIDEKLYAVAGIINDSAGPGVKLERYEPVVNVFTGLDRWNTDLPATALAPLPTPREGLTVAVLGGQLYALGGHTTGGDPTGAVESYDPGTNSWTSRAPLPIARTWPAAAVVGSTLYAVGGGEQFAPSNTIEAYNATLDAWTTLVASPMPTPRTGLAAAVVNGKLYAIGGFDGFNNVGTVEVFNPATGTWTIGAPMPTPRTLLEAVAIDGLIYAVGGTSGGALGTIETYNPATNTWTTLNSMPTARSQFGLGVIDGRLWAVGGLANGGTKLAALEAFRPPEATWWSGTPAVATINVNGNANALSVGQTIISARAVGINCASSSCATLTVTDNSGPPPPPDECAQVTFTLLPGSVPFTEVQLTVLEKSSGDTFGPFPVSIGEPQAVPPGQYHFSFSAPAGYRVISAQRGVNLTCGDDINVKLRFQAGKP